jgi:prevent-host-death family protein
MGAKMRSVGAYEAKTHLSDLLDEVSRGARISITKNGVPVAVMVPPSSRGREDVAETIRKIREHRKGITLGKKSSIRELIETGRRS